MPCCEDPGPGLDLNNKGLWESKVWWFLTQGPVRDYPVSKPAVPKPSISAVRETFRDSAQTLKRTEIVITPDPIEPKPIQSEPEDLSSPQKASTGDERPEAVPQEIPLDTAQDIQDQPSQEPLIASEGPSKQRIPQQPQESERDPGTRDNGPGEQLPQLELVETPSQNYDESDTPFSPLMSPIWSFEDRGGAGFFSGSESLPSTPGELSDEFQEAGISAGSEHWKEKIDEARDEDNSVDAGNGMETLPEIMEKLDKMTNTNATKEPAPVDVLENGDGREHESPMAEMEQPEVLREKTTDHVNEQSQTEEAQDTAVSLGDYLEATTSRDLERVQSTKESEPGTTPGTDIETTPNVTDSPAFTTSNTRDGHERTVQTNNYVNQSTHNTVLNATLTLNQTMNNTINNTTSKVSCS
ncbi:hypothetical protein QBC38DRAFT_448137 [Podospora fimiseda]|uniref:Uncharacterized protein n=1 Tax=Podospora fimiseda TaxID=252190 RepID=A0AAN6YTM2_9PEZI|nr:hypothetical protein QBC38DRAFT_448137 [Podospora fimiseda]